MKKICIINQPQGLGDILYLQKIGYHYQDQGYEIYWPICDFYSSYISDYIKNFKYSDFCQENKKKNEDLLRTLTFFSAKLISKLQYKINAKIDEDAAKVLDVLLIHQMEIETFLIHHGIERLNYLT